MSDFEYASSVPMTPDESLWWDVDYWPETGGNALLSPDCPSFAIDALRKAAVLRSDNEVRKFGLPAGGGASGLIRHLPEQALAVKIMYEFIKPHAEYPPLKANVTLEHGLRRTDQTGNRVTYATPHYYGAYFPFEMGGDGNAVWVMSYEEGEIKHAIPGPIRRQIPNVTRRSAVYRRALAACGGDPDGYDLDMDIGNELFRIHDEAGTSKPRIDAIKFDVSVCRSMMSDIDQGALQDFLRRMIRGDGA